jgi:hypothetical protein
MPRAFAIRGSFALGAPRRDAEGVYPEPQNEQPHPLSESPRCEGRTPAGSASPSPPSVALRPHSSAPNSGYSSVIAERPTRSAPSTTRYVRLAVQNAIQVERHFWCLHLSTRTRGSMRSSKLGLATIIGVLTLGASCGETSQEGPTATGGSAAEGGIGGQAGSQEPIPEPVPCGRVTCRAIVLPAGDAVAPCCVNPLDGICGADVGALLPTRTMGCQPLTQPGKLDASCPASVATVVGGFPLPPLRGCCREATGQCGYLMTDFGGLLPFAPGCIDAAPFLDDGEMPRACGAGATGGSTGSGGGGGTSSGGASNGAGGTNGSGGASSAGDSNGGSTSGGAISGSSGAAGHEIGGSAPGGSGGTEPPGGAGVAGDAGNGGS